MFGYVWRYGKTFVYLYKFIKNNSIYIRCSFVEYMVGLRKLQFCTLVLRSFNVLITNYLYTINLINFTRYSVLPNVITIRPYSQQSTGFFMSKF